MINKVEYFFSLYIYGSLHATQTDHVEILIIIIITTTTTTTTIIHLSMLWMARKKNLNQFQIFLKISLAVMVEINNLALRAFIDYFDTISSLIKEKQFQTNFIISKALFRVAQQKILLLLLLLLLL